MKVEIERDDGTVVEHQAENSYHAHNMMLMSFSIFYEGEEEIHVVEARCDEIDAKMWLNSEGQVVMQATDMKFVNEMNGGEL